MVVGIVESPWGAGVAVSVEVDLVVPVKTAVRLKREAIILGSRSSSLSLSLSSELYSSPDSDCSSRGALVLVIPRRIGALVPLNQLERAFAPAFKLGDGAVAVPASAVMLDDVARPLLRAGMKLKLARDLLGECSDLPEPAVCCENVDVALLRKGWQFSRKVPVRVRV